MMPVSPEQLHELLKYCIDFAQTMLKDSAAFFPFGATLDSNGKVGATGGWDGNEHPNPQDIYRLLAETFQTQAKSGSALAFALAVDVNIPPEYSAPCKDGIRVHLESSDFSRFIYIPYKITTSGLIRKSRSVEIFEPFSVQISPTFFSSVGSA